VELIREGKEKFRSARKIPPSGKRPLLVVPSLAQTVQDYKGKYHINSLDTLLDTTAVFSRWGIFERKFIHSFTSNIPGVDGSGID
jgi:hypothetical protein